MTPQRFQETGESSFFGSFVYDRVVPPDHFLRQLRERIPWERFSEKLLACYQGGAREGRPPYNPALLLRMLLSPSCTTSPNGRRSRGSTRTSP
ncbi:MAG: hypothetical protein ACUVXH_11765 [Anaerolineae bacterium]